MVTQTEEQQAREFLKRAEIRTMKKDLRQLRESDALKERDKIAKIRTLEEQLEERKKVETDALAKSTSEKAEREKVLTENARQERLAEKDLKEYATEPERQQIFLLESERLSFEKQIDAIDREKDPALKLEKNKLLLQKRDTEAKLKPILEQERRLEDEQKTVVEKSQTTTIPSQKKALEQRKWDLDKEIQEVEKRRWQVEKEIQDIDEQIKNTDRLSQSLVQEKNNLRDKVLGIDKSLREIYSSIIARVEERRRGDAEEQKTQRESLSKIRSEKREKIRKEQWQGPSVPKKKEFLKTAPESFKEKMASSAVKEEEQRQKFLRNVESWAEKETEKEPESQNQQPNPPIPVKK
jgi:hypothetical protein